VSSRLKCTLKPERLASTSSGSDSPEIAQAPFDDALNSQPVSATSSVDNVGTFKLRAEGSLMRAQDSPHPDL
jgi:hypothetical protein